MSLQAGAATSDLSPIQPMQLCGYPHVRRISTGVHDPLLASALYLRNGSSAVLLCALDLIMFNCDVARRIRQSVAKAVGVDEACVLISCTHTHSAPVTIDYLPFSGDIAMPSPDPSYLEYVEKRILAAAMEAKKRARPAELAWTTANARGVGGNRHSLDGATDPEAGVLAVRSGGKWLAVVLIYGMHPTVLHEDSTLLSGDFPYYARLHLQEALGKELVVLYHTGPAGNQSPRYHVKGQTFAEAERLGRKLGEAALGSVKALGASDRFTNNPILAGSLQAVDLHRRQFPSVADAEKVLAEYRATYERLKAEAAERAKVRTAEVSVFGAEALLKLAKAQQTGEIDRLLSRVRPFAVQALRVGEACIAVFPGEFFAEYALDLKNRAAARSFMVTYANGELQGYIVTPQAAAVGGYEAASSMFAPAEGVRMVDTAVKMIERLAK